MSSNTYFKTDRKSLATEINENFLNNLTLDAQEIEELTKRGLKQQFFTQAGYKTWQNGKNTQSAKAVSKIDSSYNLTGHPGFFINANGSRAFNAQTGMLIPIRDIGGNINYILNRPRKAINNRKYLLCSSGNKTEGGKAFPTTHCPVVNVKDGKPKNCGSVIRITEGPLKADIATALGNYYTLGLNGVNTAPQDLKNVLLELEVSTVKIALDSEDSAATYKMIAELHKLVKDLGLDVEIETWDENYKGLDDILFAKGESFIRRMSDDEVKMLLKKAGFGWIHIISTKEYTDAGLKQRLDKSQLAKKLKLPKDSLVDEMVTESVIDIVDCPTFAPGQELLIEEDGLRKINTWVNPCVEPIDGDASIFENHLKFLVPDEQERQILIEWLAYQVQNPGVKIRWSVVLCGKHQQTGKSTIGHFMRKVLGEDNVKSPSNERLHEIYTDWQEQAQLVIVEEIKHSDRIELMNKMKPFITEPTTMVRLPGGRSYTMPNRYNILMTTNHEDALLVDQYDKRYCIIQVPVERNTDEYYQKLYEFLDSPDCAGVLMNYFKKIKLDKFNPKGTAPMTKQKLVSIEASRNALEQFIFGRAEDRAHPFNMDVVSIRHIKASKSVPQNLLKFSDFKWAEVMKDAGFKQYEKPVYLEDGSRVRLWIVPEVVSNYENATPEEMKQAFTKWLQNSEPGGNPVDDALPM